jgi:pimeloyl-ACP methyl ester carboxylesterase
MMSDDLRQTMITTNGVTLHVAQSGPEDGPPVILLHGFPEPWFCWRHQIGPLAEAGHRVFAPDQRGYNTSAKPPRIADYALDVLAADVIGLIEASGHAKATLVGHDWGGIVAWWTTLRHQERVERLAVLNAPHPVAFRRYLLRHPAQLLRSWYAFYFQLPWLPEASLRRANWQALARTLRTTSRPGAFPDGDLDQYRRAWSEPGAITAMIQWYRAALRHPSPTPSDPRVHVPTLVLWGVRDAAINRGAAEVSRALCDDGRLEWFEEATHWLHREEPERVNRLLLDFLGPRPDAGAP